MVGAVPENLSREHYVYLAKLSEQSKRYDDMVSFVQKLVESTPASELSLEESKLLSVAYKNVIGSLRAAWRIVSSIDEKEEGRKNKDHVVFLKEYKSKVEAELTNVCASVLELLDSSLIPFASSSESKVFYYYKMKGDYQRYLAEFEKKSAVEDAMLSYKIAQDIAVADLPASHPVRLGLALNLSVSYYDILNQRDKACDMAIQAFVEANNAAGELVKLGEEYYKESKLTMQLLRDNIFLWTPYLQQKDLHALDFTLILTLF